jgi:hypothetical protein
MSGPDATPASVTPAADAAFGRPPPPVHEDVGAAVAAVIPPRPVPWRKRIFWAIVLRLLRSPRGAAWLAARQRR